MEATGRIFVVQALAKWVTSVTQLHRPTNSMEALEKSSMSKEAAEEERIILEAIPVRKCYYLLKTFPLT
jgi:hypothetical protein